MGKINMFVTFTIRSAIILCFKKWRVLLCHVFFPLIFLFKIIFFQTIYVVGQTIIVKKK